MTGATLGLVGSITAVVAAVVAPSMSEDDAIALGFRVGSVAGHRTVSEQSAREIIRELRRGP